MLKKTANKSASIHTNQILLSSNWLELSPWSLTQVFKKIETTIRWNCMSKALRFLQITAEHQDCPFFTVFLTTKSLSQNISITLLQLSLKLHQHGGCYWRNKLPWMIFKEQFPVPRYTVASEIGNSVISLLWQLRCHCNLDHNKFSSLSHTTEVAIFPNLCLWRRSLCSNLRGIDPDKLNGATLTHKILIFSICFSKLVTLTGWLRSQHVRRVARERVCAPTRSMEFFSFLLLLLTIITAKPQK